MGVVQVECLQNMGSDLNRRAAEATIQPVAEVSLLCRREAGLTPFPTIDRELVPAICSIGLVPTANGVVVQVEKLCDLLAGLAVIQQQDGIGPTRNTMILALATHAKLKFAPFCRREKARTDHAVT